MTMDAAAYNETQLEDGSFTPEHIVELVKFWQAGHDLEVDGKAGPVTRSTIEAAIPDSLSEIEEWDLGKWKPWDGPLQGQPRNRKAVYAVFGNPGVGKPNRRWERINIVECHQRLGTRLPGVPAKWWVKIHRVVEPYLREALRRAQIAAPEYAIERLAGYVFRHQRHDSSRPLSYHSWGIAVDIDSHKNFSRRFRTPGDAPLAWSPKWMEIWPEGVPESFVEAFLSCGWTWGGNWSRYIDGMHFEFVGGNPV